MTIIEAVGVASSSCSYAAVALARSIFQRGASFTNAMAFELASTNLVIELPSQASLRGPARRQTTRLMPKTMWGVSRRSLSPSLPLSDRLSLPIDRHWT